MAAAEISKLWVNNSAAAADLPDVYANVNISNTGAEAPFDDLFRPIIYYISLSLCSRGELTL